MSLPTMLPPLFNEQPPERRTSRRGLHERPHVTQDSWQAYVRSVHGAAVPAGSPGRATAARPTGGLRARLAGGPPRGQPPASSRARQISAYTPPEVYKPSSPRPPSDAGLPQVEPQSARFVEELKVKEEEAKPPTMNVTFAPTPDELKESSRLKSDVTVAIGTNAKTLREAFLSLDTDRSGKVSADELEVMLSKWNLLEKKSAAEREAAIKNVIAAVDKDGDGQIDWSEFIEGLAGYDGPEAFPYAPDAPRRQHSRSDLNLPHAAAPASEAQLKREMNALTRSVATRYATLKRAFIAFDADHSGFITRDELLEGVKSLNLTNIPVEHVEQLFDQIDEKGEGQVDYARFCAQIASNPEATF